MYSRLDPLFKTQLRHAETLDTRQGIRHHEQDSDKKERKNTGDRPDDRDLWEDDPKVSVRALQAFLRELLKETAAAEGGAGEAVSVRQESSKPQDGRSENKPRSEQAAQAAQAYQRTYSATHDDLLQAPAAQAIPGIELRPEEIRIIHTLIEDLSDLAQLGVEQITLRESTSFLQSLVDGVDTLKRTT